MLVRWRVLHNREFFYFFFKNLKKKYFVEVNKTIRLLRAFVYGFCALICLCVRIRLFRIKRLLRKDTDSWFLKCFGDPIFRIRRFVGLTDYPNFRFIDSFNVRASDRDDWTAWRIIAEDPMFRVLSSTICTFWLECLKDTSSWFSRNLYPTLFTWLTVQLLPRTVSCWAR